jgi:hypothetical protein
MDRLLLNYRQGMILSTVDHMGEWNNVHDRSRVDVSQQ